MKNFLIGASLLALSLSLSACTDADIASSNLSKAADNFEVNRRVVFYNGITGEYMLSIEGLCSLGNYDSSGFCLYHMQNRAISIQEAFPRLVR